MNCWERNHFKLLRLVEWREEVLSGSVERLLLKIGREYRKRDYAPGMGEMVRALEPLIPFVKNLVAAAGISGAAESLVRANYDLRTPFGQYFRHGSLPNQITLDKVWQYLEATGFDRGPLVEQMRAHTRRITETLAGLAERKIRESVVEGVSQKWTLARMKGQLEKEFDGLKRQDVESVMPNVETVIRTESMTVLHASQWESAQCTPALRSMLWGFQYSAVGDARTRPNHYAQDGATAPVDSDFWNHWYPPNGYNCRCSVLPLYVEPEPDEQKEPRWDLKPDKGFDFNPGRSKPFNLGTPQTVSKLDKKAPKEEPETESVEKIIEEPRPAPRPAEKVVVAILEKRLPELENWGKTGAEPLPVHLPEPEPKPAPVRPAAPPREVVPVSSSRMGGDGLRPGGLDIPKPDPQPVRNVSAPVEPVPERNKFRKMSQEEMLGILLTVRSRYGSGVAGRITLVPSPTGCEMFWDGVFVASVDFELDGSGIQLALEPVRKFKAACGKVKETFYTLWDAVAWVVGKKTEKKPNTKVPESLKKRAGTNGHGIIFNNIGNDYYRVPDTTCDLIIQERTGLTLEESRDIRMAIHAYSGGGFSIIQTRRGDCGKRNAELLDLFLQKSDVWDNQGIIYRGIKIRNDSRILKWKVGEIHRFSNFTSWSSYWDTAKWYSQWDENRDSVMFKLKKSYMSCSIAEISDTVEAELIMRRNTNLRVCKITKNTCNGFQKLIIELEEVYE